MTLPPFRTAALLLDLDGTLLDIAPTPDAVVVPPGLIATLRGLGALLDGAVAIVTGRTLDVVDALLGDAAGTIAGEHGGAIRPGLDAPVERPLAPAPPPEWIDAARALVATHPGSLFEQKPRGFGVHFRQAPDAGPAIHAALSALIATDPAFELMPSHMLWEVRPRGVDKGQAVTSLMRRPPFLGRAPVFIGDDVTDEDGMRVARAMGGSGLRVRDFFGDAAGVRAWLSETATRGDWVGEWGTTR
jgi:trehalose 6-phosphate phosphatase